jgi:signal transduction histidine kinase
LQGPKDELRDLADTVDSMLDRLDEAFRAQRQLIDDASHELRSPLAIIRANLDAVLTAEESDEEERRTAARSVDRATTRMTGLVEDLLATARRSAPALADADVDLAAAAGEACEEFTPLAADRGLALRRRLPAGLTVIGDHDALRRAVGNLLSNAVRLSPPGTRITVAAGRTGSWLWTAVRDEGPGILDDDQARVFDRFWRAGAGGGGRDRHAGLGLAIVRQIVESHGGQVRLFSRVGEGSTFVLWFPASGTGPANAGPANAERANGDHTHAGHANGGPPEEQPAV